MKLTDTTGYKIIQHWFETKSLYPFAFQEETWQEIVSGNSGLVNAPTGYGKTYSVFIGALIQFINLHPDSYQKQKNNGLQLLWITPLRALAKDIGRAMEEVLQELQIPWKVGIRNGDTSTAERAKQKKQMPEILIITPESLHLLLAQKNYTDHFKTLQLIAIDEWHESAQIQAAAEVDSALLSDPLPPDAYRDPGFLEFLKAPPVETSDVQISQVAE